MSEPVHVRSQQYYDPNTLSWVAAQQSVLEAGTVNLSATGLAKETGGNLATLTAKDFATSAKQDTQTTALQLIDNIVSGAGANITQLGGVNVSMNTGVRDTGTQRVTIATNDVVPVTGTFFQATQPVSVVSLPLPTGAATNTVLTDGTLRGTVALSAGSAVVGHVINDASTAVIGHVIVDTAPTTAVTGTFFQATQPVSLTTLPALTTGSATIGKVDQGAAGASKWVVTADIAASQTIGLAAGAAVIGHVIADASSAVIGHVISDATSVTNATLSAETTKVIGTVNVASGQAIQANAGTNLNTSLLALETTQVTGNSSLASVKTNTDPLVAAGAGAYVRQDSTATIAKETGGNLATIATNTTSIATAANQTTGNASLSSMDTKLTSQATAAKQDTGNTSLATIATEAAPLLTAQGAVSAALTGPIVQAVVSDTPQSYSVDTAQPFSLTSEGRLRVSVDAADINRVWNHAFDNPWDTADQWTAIPGAGESDMPHAGASAYV